MFTAPLGDAAWFNKAQKRPGYIFFLSRKRLGELMVKRKR
jgi:hypothetical protein